MLGDMVHNFSVIKKQITFKKDVNQSKIFIAEEIVKSACEGWDSNPRTPARPGPEPGAVDRAWLPSRLYRLRLKLNKDRGSLDLCVGTVLTGHFFHFLVAELFSADLSGYCLG
jgi:hypothetical protein